MEDPPLGTAMLTVRESRGLRRGQAEMEAAVAFAVESPMPSPEEVPEMGMIRVSNMLAGLVDTGRFIVRKASFDPQEAVALLKQWENGHIRHIVGPPFLVHKLIQYLRKHDIRLKLDRETRIITMGGWKRFTGRQFREKNSTASAPSIWGFRSTKSGTCTG
jgi:hypothetical protein